jgi:hypothetical protein
MNMGLLWETLSLVWLGSPHYDRHAYMQISTRT